MQGIPNFAKITLELHAKDKRPWDAGVLWSIGGKHDQGWREREIFDKIRYMNDAGLKRKFNMSSYVLKMKKLAQDHMPPEHAAVRASKKGKEAIKQQMKISQLSSSGKKRKRRD